MRRDEESDFFGQLIKKRRTGNCEENRFFYVWSVELYFGINVCFWLLHNNFIQKLSL